MILNADTVEAVSGTGYPAPFAAAIAGRSFHRLGRTGGLTQFGVNLVRLQPGAWSSQRHWHSHEDEFIWMLEGELVLVTEAGETLLRPGQGWAFPAGRPDGHHLQNRSEQDALFLAVGVDAPNDDVCTYPDIDMLATPAGFVHRDGTAW